MKNIVIDLKSVALRYELHHDKTNNLKEMIINLLLRRKPTQVKSTTFYALQNVNLQIHEGERVGIIGRNGAGKSTLLKVISGILRPTRGSIQRAHPVQPLIELGAGFDFEFTGRENIYLNAYMLGFTKKEVLENEQEIIDFSGVGQFIDTPIKYYSSGMILRLAFTIATSIKPEILVFDEVLAVGDAEFLQKASERLKSLLSGARAMVVVSHDMDFIRANCERCIFMEGGQVVFDGPTEECIKRYLP